ncbi:MAG: hypothetical protein GX877_03645 [Bacteroidales bacterium]|nr:hypothetical protein [Bacteroidales bacterium]
MKKIILFSMIGGILIQCTPREVVPTTPSVNTGEITAITATTATCTCEVTADGGSQITARGVCWNTSENPTTANAKTTDGSGHGIYTSHISGLTPNVTYHVRAYATNAQGTAYGRQESFTTDQGEVGATFTDSRDGKVYKTVVIGDQVWMAENLAYLPSVQDSATSSTTEPYYYVYDYNGTDVVAAKATDNYKTYGVLYNWTAAIHGATSNTANPGRVQGACPAGWHLPRNAEWTQLETYLADNGHNYDGTTGGGNAKIAKSLASESGWDSSDQIGAVGNTDYPNYRNKSGFSTLPGGMRFSNGLFSYMGSQCFWWSAPDEGASSAWGRAIGYDSATVFMSGGTHDHGFSVRCLRD